MVKKKRKSKSWIVILAVIAVVVVLAILSGKIRVEKTDSGKLSSNESEWSETIIEQEQLGVKNIVYYGDANGAKLAEGVVEAGRPLTYYLWIFNEGSDEKCKTLLYDGDIVFADRDYEEIRAGESYSRKLTIVVPTYSYVANDIVVSDREVVCEAYGDSVTYKPELRIRSWSLKDRIGDWYPNAIILEKFEEDEYEEDGVSVSLKAVSIGLDKCQLVVNGIGAWMNEKEYKRYGNFTIVLGQVSSYSKCYVLVLKN